MTSMSELGASGGLGIHTEWEKVASDCPCTSLECKVWGRGATDGAGHPQGHFDFLVPFTCEAGSGICPQPDNHAGPRHLPPVARCRRWSSTRGPRHARA